MMAVNRMSTLAHLIDPHAESLSKNLAKYKEESEKEVMEVCSPLCSLASCQFIHYRNQDATVLHHHNVSGDSSVTSSPTIPTRSTASQQTSDKLKKTDDISAKDDEPVIKAMANASLKQVDEKTRTEDALKKS
jgi:hypothetical protein